MSTTISNKLFLFAVIGMLFASTAVCVFADDGDAASSYTVTDGQGTEFSFSEAPSHIVTAGTGISATAIQIGSLSKIVVCDKYTKTNTSSVFADLQTKINNNEVRANGSCYSSGQADLKADIVYVTDNGGFDKAKDAIILTGSFTTLQSLVDELRTLGYQKVMVWKDITDYADLVGFIRSVSLAINGEVTSYVAQMENLSEYISSHLSGVEKKGALYTTYSSSDYKVGNNGSLANSMIVAAGGTSITVDGTKSGSTYGDKATLTKFIVDNPTVVIFLDNSIAKDSSKVAEVTEMCGSTEHTMVALDPLWNNYSIASMDGVWAMACAMYPDIFHGDIPTVNGGSNDNTVLYIGAAVAAVAIIGVAGFIFMRR